MPFDLGYPAHQANFARPGLKGFSLQAFYARFPDEESCLRHVLESRLSETPLCSCGRMNPWRWIRGTTTFQHVCRTVRSPLAGTIFHSSKLPVHIWLYAMLHIANSPGSVSVGFLERHLGLSVSTSMRLAERIRLHLAALEAGRRIGSGSQPAVVRLVQVRKILASGRRRNLGQVLAVGDGHLVSTAVVPLPRRHRLRHVLRKKLDPAARVITDCHYTYRSLSGYGWLKPIAALVPHCFDRESGDVDVITGFMSSFRYGLAARHIHIYEENLWKYLKEYEFRYNRRHCSESTFPDMVARFPSLMGHDIEALRLANFVER